MTKIAHNGVVLLMVLGPLFGRLAAQMPTYSLPMHSATQAVAVITIGDYDPLHIGNELSCVMADGSVVELVLGQSGWTASTIFKYKGNSLGPWEPTTSSE
jgi:hypothetical protein